MWDSVHILFSLKFFPFLNFILSFTSDSLVVDFFQDMVRAYTCLFGTCFFGGKGLFSVLALSHYGKGILSFLLI